jgi:hypothetical protein
MAEKVLKGSYVSIDESNIRTNKSGVQQLVDIVQSDIRSLSSNTRKKYQVFVSGGVGLTEITSSLHQTVFDQDFTLPTSNPLFDITVGSYQDNTNATAPVVNGITCSVDASGKLVPGDGNKTPMLREKVGIYRQFAQNLLGDANSYFVAPHGETHNVDNAKRIDAAIFICFRRLFVRDNIYKGSFAMRVFKNAGYLNGHAAGADFETNLDKQPDDDSSTVSNALTIIDDALSASHISIHPTGGEVSTLQNEAGEKIGLIYYDSGIIVLDAESTFNKDQVMRGLIESTADAPVTEDAGVDLYNDVLNPSNNVLTTDILSATQGQSILSGAFYPHFWVSGTIDDVTDHLCNTRFDDGNLTAIAFRNETVINSSLIFCRATPSQLNYSTNPTYTDSDGKILALDTTTNNSFTFVTTVGLYDTDGFLLAVAKTSRPIEKNPETDLSIRIRLDY